jgi:hypothetical protein
MCKYNMETKCYQNMARPCKSLLLVIYINKSQQLTLEPTSANDLFTNALKQLHKLIHWFTFPYKQRTVYTVWNWQERQGRIPIGAIAEQIWFHSQL